MALDVAHIGFCQRATRPCPSWVKATDMHIAAYKETLHTRLQDTVLPCSAILCKDVCCTNIEHIDSLNLYASQIATACLSSANDTIPFPRCRGTRGCIPGSTEFVDPLRNNSLFDCGRSRNGIVAEVMRKTRAQYHAAIRKARREEDNNSQ